MGGFTRHATDISTEGGNMQTVDVGKAIATDAIFDDKQRKRSSSVIEHLYRVIHSSDMIAVKDKTGMEIEHIDCWAKVVAPKTLLIGKDPREKENEKKFSHAKNVFRRAGFEVTEIEMDQGGMLVKDRKLAPYCNSLIFNNTIYIPGSGNKGRDDKAVETYRTVTKKNIKVVSYTSKDGPIGPEMEFLND